MKDIKRVIDFCSNDGWKWYGWISFLILKFLIVCGQTIYAIYIINQFSLFSDAIVTYFIPVLGLCKVYASLVFRSKLEHLFSLVNNNFWDTTIISKDLSDALSWRISLISRNIFSHICVSLALCFAITLYPLAGYDDDRKVLPSVVWLPFDTNPSPIYEILYVIIGISNHVSVIFNLSYDSTYVYFIQHLSVQFVLLENVLKNVTDISHIVSYSRYNSKIYQTIIWNRLKICIDHHNMLLRFLNDVQTIFSFCLGVQYLLSILALVFTGYILATNQTDFVKILKLLVYALALSIQVLMYALSGSLIEKEYETLATAAYKSDWYYGNRNFRQGIEFVTMRSQKRLVINGLGLIEMNNGAIIVIYKTVFSVLTLLRQVME